MILFLTLLLSFSCIENLELDDSGSFSKLSTLSQDAPSGFDEKTPTIFQQISDKATYLVAGTALGSLSLLARLGFHISQISPWPSPLGKECHLLSQLCSNAAKRAFTHIFTAAPSLPSLFKGIPFSHYSWHLNKYLLSHIPASSDEEKQLLLFLERRWLAKSSGFYSSMINWVCPCFGISVQVHPETSHTYARDPWMKRSQTYISIVEAWKHSLPHPHHFPLILTRPFDLQEYLPSYLHVSQYVELQTVIERLALTMQKAKSKVVVNLTDLFSRSMRDPKKWLLDWETYRIQFSQACKQRDLNLDRIVCIQRVKREEIGGIRLLPLNDQASDLDHQFLLEWISTFGLSANRIELDRAPLPSNISVPTRDLHPVLIKGESREAVISSLNSFELNWNSTHPQKNLMLKGTVHLLKKLVAVISKEKWNEIVNSPTQLSLVQLSFLKISEQLKFLRQEKDKISFFDTALSIEQIHAHLSALLEIFSPFTYEDFPSIYQNFLTSLPENLKSLTSCGIHSSGMTSLAGIFKATEKAIGKTPRILYGENTYFENINAAKLVSNASSVDEAKEQDWKDVDLILAQFNPVLKRIDLKKIDSQVTEYRVERVSEAVRKALSAREAKPLTIAFDCTLDFIDSPRIGRILSEFHKEIEGGMLNIICYRSGLKFDLFGMDNYCGAPIYMIHSRDAQWTSCDALIKDPVLQTDTLSLNWFCLAYQSSAPELEVYRKQIFDNTRALLNKIPLKLFNHNSTYRVIPCEEEADPAFIDIKIVGSFHQMRGAALVAGILFLKCIEAGHPIFYRQSLGFYHPNCTLIFDTECTTIRLTLGLDPAQVGIMADCFKTLAALRE